MAVVETLPWFEHGKPLRNWMLHETDFYDEVEQIWGRRWGAEGVGTLREVLVSRPTENETRDEYAQEWQYYYSSAAGNADLGRLRYQFDEYYELLRDNGVRVNYLEAPVPAIGQERTARLTLDDALRLAERENPTLRAKRFELDVTRAGEITAGLRPNPSASYTAEKFGASGQEYTITVGQTLELGGKRERRLDSARAATRVTRFELDGEIRFVLENLGLDLVVAHSPGWHDSIANGNIGTTHMDMVMLTVDERKVLLAPHLVNYGFIRELKQRDVTIIEVPLEEYWDLAINGVTLAPGKIVINRGSPIVVGAS